jgi:acyl-CoA reductase-like NAD-dependent aldehyde dehydrogenase
VTLEQDIAVPASVGGWLGKQHLMLIGGEWVPAADGETFTVENPATEQEIARVPRARAADVDEAVRAARRSFETGVWRMMAPVARQQIMWRFADLIASHQDELGSLDILDNGMPRMFADRTIAGAADGMRFYAGMCTKVYGRTAPGNGEFHSYTQRVPVGVAALIIPWNGPVATAVIKLAPSLAAGCSVVLKPAEQTPLSALRLGELALDAGIPPGVLNVVTGYGQEAGAALAQHPDVDKISFTGSTAVGKELVRNAADNLKRVTLELGGKSPVFVFPDADLSVAIPTVSMGIFGNSGQMCYAGSRVYAHPEIHDDLVAGVQAFAEQLKLGNGLDPSSQLGPLVSAKQRDNVMSYIGSGLEQGAELVTGGQTAGSSGYFVEPTIFTQVSPEMRIVREEIFGPVLTVSTFDGLEDVARLGNDSPYGLGAGIYTTDLSTAHRAAAVLEAGNIWVNCYATLDRSLPFGGFKQSGWGRENGEEGLSAFQETKSIYMKL